MNMRKKLDISAYLVVGPENTLGRPVGDIIRAAVENGFTCLQIRSKTAGGTQRRCHPAFASSMRAR